MSKKDGKGKKTGGSGPTGSSSSDQPAEHVPGEVHQISDFRALRDESNRREAERYFLDEMLQVFSVTGTDVLTPVQVIDASETGLSIRVPFRLNAPTPNPGDIMSMRLYFNHNTYLVIGLSVKNSMLCIEQGAKYFRLGCTVDKTFKSYDAYRHFVMFLDHLAKAATRVTAKKAG